jgi:hypothetical protein
MPLFESQAEQVMGSAKAAIFVRSEQGWNVLRSRLFPHAGAAMAWIISTMPDLRTKHPSRAYHAQVVQENESLESIKERLQCGQLVPSG